jgi:nicotinamidase-related amidase
VLAAFREADAAIFHIRHRGGPESSFEPHRTGFAVLDEAREFTSEPVIEKAVNSAFIGTDLEQRLHAADIDSVVICGATTNHCVETSTRMAGNLGFATRLVSDATWTFDLTGPDGRLHRAEQIQAMTEANLSGEFAEIVYTDDVTRGLSLPVSRNQR